MPAIPLNVVIDRVKKKEESMSFKTKKLGKIMNDHERKALEFEEALQKSHHDDYDDETNNIYVRVPRVFEFELEPVEDKPQYWRDWWTGRYYVPLVIQIADNGRVWARLRNIWYDR